MTNIVTVAEEYAVAARKNHEANDAVAEYLRRPEYVALKEAQLLAGERYDKAKNLLIDWCPK